MRWMFGLTLVITAPAVAQTVLTPFQADSHAFTREQIAAAELNRVLSV